jgi:CubicO group peptidase (beta-lactamase class C family)
VIENASGQNINLYTQQKLKNQTGMTGTWLKIGFDNVYFSRPRAMARFGILIQNKGKWANTTVLGDTGYIRQMVNTSQDLNKSYGYLWWLNGKSSFMIPTLQINFPGPISPSGPSDMYAAIGKNGQILSIAPSSGIVFVRMGNSPDADAVSFVLLDQIWQKLNAVICQTTSVKIEKTAKESFWISQHSETEIVFHSNEENQNGSLTILNSLGQMVWAGKLFGPETQIKTPNLRPGVYYFKITSGKSLNSQRFVIR